MRFQFTDRTCMVATGALPPPPVADRRRGFALVVTLSLMILLTVIAVGLLTLSAVSMRTSSQGRARAEAQANARLALLLAIGELQRSMGPDRNVTAPASILDSAPETSTPDGLRHPLLTGVWRSRDEGLEQVPDYNRATPFRQWLVSNTKRDDLERLDFATSGTLVDPVSLVAASSRQGAPAVAAVQAGRIAAPGGACAWWVGDENCKALINPKDEIDRTNNTQVADLLASFATPGTHGVEALAEFQSFPSNSPAADSLITRDQLDLAGCGSTRSREFFHDLSPYSQSVLANVTDGSLRKDLSLYLERSDIDWLEGWGLPEGKSGPPAGPLGPNGKIALSPPGDYDVLAWKYLHHWYNMHRRQLGTGANLPVTAMANYTPAIDPVSNPAWNSGVTSITPVLARLQMVVSCGVTKRATPNEYDLNFYRYPIVTLWNPYNVGMVVNQWSVFLHNLPLEHTIKVNGKVFDVKVDDWGKPDPNFTWRFPHGTAIMRFGDGSPGITFAPGEAKVLTYSSFFHGNGGWNNAFDMVDRVIPWQSPDHVGGWTSLTLSPQANINTPVRARPGDRITIETKAAAWETGGTSNWDQESQHTFEVRCEPKAQSIDKTPRMLKQMFSSEIGWRRESTNPASTFVSESNFPSMTLGDLVDAPTPILHLDVRLKTLDEVQLPNKTWLHCLPGHPFAASTSTSKHAAQGVDNATTFFAHPYAVAFEQKTTIEGLIQNRPFIGPSNTPAGVGVIADREVPLAPLTSLAQLQNLPLYPIEALNWSGYYSQNHAVGNSFASPGLPPSGIKEQSFPFYLGQGFPWKGGDIAGTLYPNTRAFNNADYVIAPAPAAVVDRSYAANQLLFDDYFFSSMAAQEGEVFRRYGTPRTLRTVADGFFQGTQPLPNSRYLLHLPSGADRATLADGLVSSAGQVTADAYRKVAANLMVAGGFNVNSTSVPAWTAMLATAHLKRPVTMANGTLKTAERGRFIVSRFSHAIGPAADNASGHAAEERRWLGYRELTAGEIGQLAGALVEQVKKRGPFRSLGEFVNRRRSSDVELARHGAVQAALEDPKVEINKNYRGSEITAADIADTQYKFKEAALGSRYQGTPACVSQADLLMPIAPLIQVRSDTFQVRGYGESRSPDGKVQARAWCEAIVQRVPEYVDPQDPAERPAAELTSKANQVFGRRFLVTSFRWLSPSEIEPS